MILRWVCGVASDPNHLLGLPRESESLLHADHLRKIRREQGAPLRGVGDDCSDRLHGIPEILKAPGALTARVAGGDVGVVLAVQIAFVVVVVMG